MWGVGGGVVLIVGVIVFVFGDLCVVLVVVGSGVGDD